MIVVNSSTRQLNIPGADLVFGVTDDSGSETKHFQCPRYVGNGVDIASSFVRINYRNANGVTDFHKIDVITVDGDNVLFDWELHPKVTKYKGNVTFVMCVVGPDLKVKWHTTLGRGQVLEGLEPDNESILEETEDAVAQLITMVEAQTAAVEAEGATQVKAVQTAAKTAETASVAQIEAKGVSTLATIPGDYTAAVSALRGAANAIRKKVSGEVIRVDDVSPIEHYPVVKVRGKNLFNIGALEPMPENYTTRISAIDVENGTFTITTADSHTGNGYCGLTNGEGNYVLTLRDLCPHMEAGKTYVLSGTTDTATKTIYLRGVNKSWIFGKTMFITEEYLDAKIAMYGLNYAGGEGAGDCTISNLQIEEGETATDYTPYIDPTTVTVRRCGKNIIPYPFTDKTVTRRGVTFTDNGDGTITIDGTAEATTSFVLFNGEMPVDGKYTLSGLVGGSGSTYYMQPVCSDKAYSGLTDGSKMYEWDRGTLNRLQLSVGVGTVFSNMRIRPMLEVGEITSDYEPYIGENQIPSADGSVSGLSALAPTMTLLTDTAGVNIECEYSRDTNKVIAEILEKITALGG